MTPRHLWDEAKAGYDWWISAGRPEHSRFGLSVTPDGEQYTWLDAPERAVPGRAA